MTLREKLRDAAYTGPLPIRLPLLFAKACQHYANRHGGWLRATSRAVSRCASLITNQGPSRLLWRLKLYLYQVSRANSYQIPLNNQLTTDESVFLLNHLEHQPPISIVVPVYRVEPRWLDLCLQSLARQHYRNWEAILVDDGSRDPELTALMTEWSQRDDRIRVILCPENQNISAATNIGIENATGDWIGFVDHDDELTPDALTWVVAALNEHPQAKWIYTDEAVIHPDGRCKNLHLKPDYSPEFLLSAMYPCHFGLYQADLIRAVGGMRVGYEGAQDHDLALRISEEITPDQVEHLPRVLYRWRAIESSTAAKPDAKPEAITAGQKAVTEALARRNIPATVTPYELCPTMFQLHLSPQRTPRVSILIPTKNQLGLLKTCIDSLRRHTNYPDYEIVVIDNQSTEADLKTYLAEQQQSDDFRVVDYDQPFNHSDMNNLAVATCDSEYSVFMNNDVELTSPQWLETLVASVQMHDTLAGASAKLLYPDGTVQHAGLIWGIGGLAGHAHRFVDDSDPGALCRANLLNEFSGGTAALLLLKKSAFEEVDGFDADAFPTSFNDVDLWLRLQQAGHRCVFNPQVTAFHYESKTRKTPRDDEAEYERRLQARWSQELPNDPFYNPNLGLDNELFANHRLFPKSIRVPKDGHWYRIEFSEDGPNLIPEETTDTSLLETENPAEQIAA